MLRFALAMAVLCTGLFSPAQAQPVRKALQPVKNLAQKCFGPNCGQQSQGFFVVGQIDPTDGAVITSVGPVVDPVPNLAPALPAESSVLGGQFGIGDRAKLMRAMLSAAREAKASGASVEQIKAAMVDAGLETLAASTQAIDIDKWIEIIEKLIPLIMKLIDLFGVNTNLSPDFQYALRLPEARAVCDWTWIGLAS